MKFSFVHRSAGPDDRERHKGVSPETPDPFSPVRRLKTCAAPGESGFTMVEIALSLAVIAFALVAIIGVLPFALGVQRENREQTVINQDASIFLDAIRSGARGLDDLTNYVEAITIENNGITKIYLNSQFPPPFSLGNSSGDLTNGQFIVGLLTTPKLVFNGTNILSTNKVIAYVHALSGSAADKYPQRDPDVRDMGFGYRLYPEIVPVSVPNLDAPYDWNLNNNLHELRLMFRWPLLANGSTGNGRMVIRTSVSGMLTNEPLNSLTYFFKPSIFVKAP